MIKLEKIMLVFLCLTILMPFFVTNVQAASLTLSTPSKDAMLSSDFQDFNFGADPRLDFGSALGGTMLYRSVVQFNLPTALSGATILSATLSLWGPIPWSGADPTGEVVRVCRVTHDWVEGTGTAVAKTQDGVTWNEYNYFDGLATATNDWGTPGGDFALTDSSTVVISSSTIQSWTVTNIVQLWASGTYPNYGFLIKLDNELPVAPKGGVFASKEYGSSTMPPKLEITYTVSNGVPELNMALPIVISITLMAYLITRKRLRK